MSVSTVSPIRVGLIGVGNWAMRGHLPILKLLPDYRITAVQARRRDVAEQAARRFDVPYVLDTAEEVANHPEVDLVLVLTTAPQHEAGIRAALAAGKHVYSEWPLTTGTATSTELMRLAEARGVKHVVGLQRRLAPVTRYVHDLVGNGYVGKPRSVRMHVSMNYFQALRDKALAWTAPPENFSSVLAIYGGHFLDMLFAMTGWPVSVSGLAVNQFKNVIIAQTGEVIPTTTPDQLVLSGMLPGNAVLTVHIEGGKRNGSGVRIDITGDAGDLRITNKSAFGDVGEDYLLQGANGDNVPLVTLTPPESYEWLPASTLPSSVLELGNLFAALARDLRTGAREAPTFADGVRMHRLLDAIMLSSDTGRQVAVEGEARHAA